METSSAEAGIVSLGAGLVGMAGVAALASDFSLMAWRQSIPREDPKGGSLLSP